WYFVWQALSHCHSPDFPAGRAQPCFDSHFCCFLLLPGRITQLQRSGEGCTWGDPNCQRKLPSKQLGDPRLLSSGNFLPPATVSHPPCHSQHPNSFQSCSQASTNGASVT
ncbi:unnamed protein product, partial [Gulo gulo]